MHLFGIGAYTLHSGQLTNFKIDCDALTDEDIAACAMLIADLVPPFGHVEGVPTGGDRLAEALQKYVADGVDQLLIVDDVMTTGASMEQYRAGREAYGAVIFSRASDWPSWIRPLFVMTSPVRR